MYEFPLVESLKEINKKQIVENNLFLELFKNKDYIIRLFNSETLVHKLSHQHIYTKFWIVNTNASMDTSVSWKEIDKLPVSSLIDNFITQYTTL